MDLCYIARHELKKDNKMLNKKSLGISVVLTLAAAMFIYAFNGQNKIKDQEVMEFAITADYPPFEYMVYGELKGFDIELATLVAEQLGKKAQFQDINFSVVLPAVDSGMADAAISTIAITEDRKKKFDFSIPYYEQSLAIVFSKEAPITTQSHLSGKKIAAQLGTTMEMWLNEHAKDAEVIAMDNNLQAVEALKAGHVDGVMIDSVQAKEFVQKNPELGFENIAKADNGYGIAFKKGSPLVKQVNQAIQTLENTGQIDELKKKYLGAE